MPDQNVIVQTSAAGASVAMDGPYQVVKLAGGTSGVTDHIEATTAAPSAAALGMVVRQVNGASVTAGVSGTVSVSGPVGVSGTLTITPTILTVNTAPTIAGASITIQQGASVSAVVSGTVTITPTTFTVNTAATVAGASITIQQGASVQAVVSGAVSISNVIPVTTAASVSVTGLPVWLNPTQQVVVSGFAGQSVQALVSGTVSLLNVVPVTTAASVSVTGIPVWLNPTQTVNIQSIASTVNVAIVAGAVGGGSVTTAAPSISASGQVMWVAGGQSTTVSPVYVSQINPPAAGGGSVTTAAPSISATGQAIWVVGGQSTTAAGNLIFVSQVGQAAVSGTISVLNVVPVTTAASVSVTALPVWLNPTQQVVVSGLAGQSVSAVVSGTVSILNVVPVTTAASVSVTGLPVWLNPTQTIVVSGNVVATTTQASGVTGALMYLAASQTIISPVQTPFLLMVTSTVGGSAGTTLLFTIWTGASQAAAGTTQWAVPSGKTLRLLNINGVINSSAATGGTAQLFMNAATASGSFTSANQATIGRPVFLQLIVSAGVTNGSIVGMAQDVAAATTIGMFQVAATAMVIGNVIITGYLF